MYFQSWESKVKEQFRMMMMTFTNSIITVSCYKVHVDEARDLVLAHKLCQASVTGIVK